MASDMMTKSHRQGNYVVLLEKLRHSAFAIRRGMFLVRSVASAALQASSKRANSGENWKKRRGESGRKTNRSCPWYRSSRLA